MIMYIPAVSIPLILKDYLYRIPIAAIINGLVNATVSSISTSNAHVRKSLGATLIYTLIENGTMNFEKKVSSLVK